MTRPSKRFLLSSLLILGVVVALIFLLSPANRIGEITPSFYYWKSNQSELNQGEKDILKEQKVKKLYVKFFEVDKQDGMGIVPTSKSNFELKAKSSSVTEIVPTVFIRNKVFADISHSDIRLLIDNLTHLIDKRFSEQFQGFSKYKEIQIDCDWTLSTRKNYHYFLRELKKKIDVQLSATLRLYPYKFPEKMGVLPVDRAMLMCYNLLPALGSGQRNSILDNVELEKYLVGAKPYPIPMDLALPVFSNVLVYKNDHFNTMIHANPDLLKDYFIEQKAPWFVVKRDTVIERIYLKKGDKVKVEKIEKKRLKEALGLIRKNVNFKGDITVSLFYLNELQLESYDQKTLHSFFTDLSK